MEQANLNIGSIGQRFEAARQAKGVSVSEAGRDTKILSKFIEAMEADDFGALSAPVYAKSFIRMYARYLGLEDQPLVEEYIAQHAPRAKGPLPDEVRQKLAKTDEVEGEANGNGAAARPAPRPPGKAVFGGVNEALARVSGTGIPMKLIGSVAGGVLLLALIVFGVRQCADDEAEVPAAGGAARVERQQISDGIPDAYLVKPGVIETAKQQGAAPSGD